MEAVGQLAGGVAHDFNNIIVATLMHLGLLQDNPHLSPDTKESLRKVEKETVRAANLTRQLLLFSRQQAARIGPLELNALIHNLLKMLRRLLGENIEIISHALSDAIWVNADAGMMEQVVMNLSASMDTPSERIMRRPRSRATSGRAWNWESLRLTPTAARRLFNRRVDVGQQESTNHDEH